MDPKKNQRGDRVDATPGLREYQTVADTVGMVPSLRVKDNVIQAVIVVVGGFAGAGIGAAYLTPKGETWVIGAMIGALGGLVLSTLISGGVIMVLGWVRAAKKLK